MPVPSNDTCATATVITTLPFSDVVDVTEATAGPDPTCVTQAEHTIWYQWTPAETTAVTITFPDDREWGTILTIYTGTCGALTEVVCAEPFPYAYDFLGTGGVTYYLQISIYDGSIPFYPSIAISVDVVETSLPPEPVLAGTSTTGRTVTLTWATLAGTNTDVVHLERSLDGTVWTEVTEMGIFGPYHDRELASDTLYLYRLRGRHETLGYGPYSNTVVTTTLGSTVEVVQYAFAVSATGAFGRMQEKSEAGTGSGFPAALEVYGVCQVWAIENALETQPGGPGTTLYHTAKVGLQYQTGSTSHFVVSDYVLATQQLAFVGPSSLSQVQYSNLANHFEVFGTLGSADTLTGTHRADGSLTLRLNGAELFAIEDIALGTQGTAGWSNVRVHPAGTLTTRAGDGSGIDQNGGLSALAIGTTAEAGASDVLDYTFATMTDDELFGASGSWLRFRGTSGSSPYVPTLWSFGGVDPLKLSDSSEGTGTAIGWMHRKSSALITPPDLWEPPGEPGDGEPPDEGEPPEPPGEGEPGSPTPDSTGAIGFLIRRLRRTPHTADEQRRVFIHRVEVDLQPGIGLETGLGSDPLVMVRYSKDGGYTWSDERHLSVGALGRYLTRAQTYRLGAARDWVFEIVVSDPAVPWVLQQVIYDPVKGTN